MDKNSVVKLAYKRSLSVMFKLYLLNEHTCAIKKPSSLTDNVTVLLYPFNGIFFAWVYYNVSSWSLMPTPAKSNDDVLFVLIDVADKK